MDVMTRRQLLATLLGAGAVARLAGPAAAACVLSDLIPGGQGPTWGAFTGLGIATPGQRLAVIQAPASSADFVHDPSGLMEVVDGWNRTWGRPWGPGSPSPTPVNREPFLVHGRWLLNLGFYDGIAGVTWTIRVKKAAIFIPVLDYWSDFSSDFIGVDGEPYCLWTVPPWDYYLDIAADVIDPRNGSFVESFTHQQHWMAPAAVPNPYFGPDPGRAPLCTRQYEAWHDSRGSVIEGQVVDYAEGVGPWHSIVDGKTEIWARTAWHW